MLLFVPLRPDPRAGLATANPLAKLGAAAIAMLVLFLSVDPITPLVMLGAIAIAVWLSGIPPRALVGRCAPLLVAAIGASVVNGVFGTGGPSLITGLATGVRLIAIALAGIVAFVTIDPTDLADALVQHLRASPRFAVGALAAFRLLPIFATEWETIGLARRARGIDDGGGFLHRAASLRERSFTLLVAAIRRGVRLALAMDARGFAKAASCRTIARPQPFTARDRILLLLAVGVSGGTVLLGQALGTWRPLFGQL
jgi:energy-coupling factor transport system permease protein